MTYTDRIIAAVFIPANSRADRCFGEGGYFFIRPSASEFRNYLMSRSEKGAECENEKISGIDFGRDGKGI